MSKYNRKKLKKHPQTLGQQLYSLVKLPKIESLLSLTNKERPKFYGKKTIPVHYKGHKEKDHLACHVKTSREVYSPSPYNKPDLYPQNANVTSRISFDKQHRKSKANCIIHGGSKGLIHNY